MRFYQQQHPYYCGIDLHARTMHVCVVDDNGLTREHVNLPCDPGRFLKVIEPYRERLVVSCECLFAWYWLADLCRQQNITFVLGHALYMKAIHGGKAKTDKIDSEKIARLLRGGMLPQAYVYPPEMRATRDLLRRRMKLMQLRGQSLAHVTNRTDKIHRDTSSLRYAWDLRRIPRLTPPGSPVRFLSAMIL